MISAALQEAEHSRPFFIALLGERYGWIPPNYRVSDRPEFDWIRDFEPGHSITEMECRFGFLTHYHRPVHAFAYKRDPAFLGEIPDEAPERRIFAFDYQGNDEITDRRNAFVADVERHPYCKNYTYCESCHAEHDVHLRGRDDDALAARTCMRHRSAPHDHFRTVLLSLRTLCFLLAATATAACRYGGLDAEGKPHVTGLAQFEQRVLEDLWAAIKTEFPPPPPPPSELAQERMLHHHFVEERSRAFVGRAPLVAQLLRFADDPGDGDSLPLLIVGSPGSGKTSLLLRFVKTYMETRPHVATIVHVVSATPASTDIRQVSAEPWHWRAKARCVQVGSAARR